MPASVQAATVPAAPKSMSSGCAATTSTRVTSDRGVAEGGNVTRSQSTRTYRGRRPLGSEATTAGAQYQQGELGSVGAQGGAVPVHDLPLAGEHQAGTARGHPGRADLLRDRGPLLPEPDDRRVDLVD